MRAFLLLLLFLPFSAGAVTVKPIGVRTVYTSVDGTTRYADVITKMTSQTYGIQYAIKKVPISLSTLGKLARAAMRGPVGLSITAALLLRDIYYDQPTDTFVSDAGAGGSGDSVAPFWYDDSGFCVAQQHYDVSSCYMSEWHVRNPGHSDASAVFQGWVGDSYRWNIVGENASGWFSSFPSCPDGFVHSHELGDICVVSEGATQTYTDTDVGQTIADSVQSGEFPTDIVSDIANDAVSSGNWVSDWPELQSQVANDVAALEQADAGTSPYTAAEEAAMKGEAATELELQKEMADDLDAIRKQQEKDDELPPIPALPSVDGIDVDTINLPELTTTDIPSPIPGGACPPPILFSALGADYSVSLQPVCDLAATMRPFLLALGWLLAAFVALGQSKSVS